jgi:hypothetical protein
MDGDASPRNRELVFLVRVEPDMPDDELEALAEELAERLTDHGRERADQSSSADDQPKGRDRGA